MDNLGTSMTLIDAKEVHLDFEGFPQKKKKNPRNSLPWA